VLLSTLAEVGRRCGLCSCRQGPHQAQWCVGSRGVALEEAASAAAIVLHPQPGLGSGHL